MSVWTATVVAKTYQRKAKLDPFRPAWFWEYKQGLLASKLSEYDITGYPAPLLPTDEAWLALFIVWLSSS